MCTSRYNKRTGHVRRTMVQSFAKTVAVVAGAMFFSTLAVNALDMRGYLAQSLLGMVFFGQSEDTGPCPVHMV